MNGAAMRRSARVRPYAMTRGRTDTRLPLLLETLVSVPDYDLTVDQMLMAESREIYALCRSVCSIAEISAVLDIPLGVVRVLVSDLADDGQVRIHPTTANAGMPEHLLLERVLRGLQTIGH
jgi:hypothetical protein